MTAASPDCRIGLHTACHAAGGCQECACHRPSRKRPTHAQLTTASDLMALVRQAEAECPRAVSIADLDTLHEVITSSRALVALVDDNESWIEPARSHMVTTGPLVAAIRRRGEQR
ncbi:hypothetical protein [Microbacterium sp. cx-55]|uniref:hypothetical protein n=1 Tax=Microbacterium sp. cx-55 TaxID=2875948 RepID=UPI001CBB52DB|nr:hypothetical protein [Microbacterium sp. cx-55]MBZ4486269.1 hypothetical protein [Microbacterium sp. cx-55]